MRFFIVGLVVSLSALANAEESKGVGFYVEPGLTYELGNWNASFPSPFNNTTGTNNGWGVDLKAGLHLAGILFAGVEGQYSQPTFSNPSNNYSATATETTLGAIAGVQLPLTGLRLWAGYLFSGTLDPGSSNNTDFKFQNGTGYKFGAGFQVLRISLNLEYVVMNYPQTILQALGPFAANTTLSNTTLNNNSFIFSVSIPINL